MTKLRKRFGFYVVLMILSTSLGFFLVSCDEDEEDILPNLSVSPRVLDFDYIEVEESSAPKTVTLRNLTSQTVIVERVTVTNAAFQVGGYFSNNALVPLVLPSTMDPADGTPMILYLVFSPDENQTEQVREYNGILIIESRKTSDDPSEIETDTVNLKGMGFIQQQ